MGESQCPWCGHIVTGFEQQDFEAKKAEHEALHAELTTLRTALAKAESKFAELENICAFKTAAITLAQKQLADGETALAKARADERERCAITAAKAVQDWIDQRKLFEMERAEMKPPYAHPEPSPLREFVASAIRSLKEPDNG